MFTDQIELKNLAWFVELMVSALLIIWFRFYPARRKHNCFRNEMQEYYFISYTGNIELFSLKKHRESAVIFVLSRTKYKPEHVACAHWGMQYQF